MLRLRTGVLRSWHWVIELQSVRLYSGESFPLADPCTSLLGVTFTLSFSSSSASLCFKRCDAGFYMPSSGATSCLACSAGWFQSSTGAVTCLACTKGKYSGEDGALACASCDPQYNSLEASSMCDRSASGYYLSPSADLLSVTCPKNAECSGGLSAPIPDKGTRSCSMSDDLSLSGRIKESGTLCRHLCLALLPYFFIICFSCVSFT